MSNSNKLEGVSREEERPVPEASLEDFSKNAIKKYLKHNDISHVVPSQDLWTYFKKRKYLRERQDRDIPTLAGIVIFAQKPDIFLPEHTITAECFSGIPEDGISLKKIIKGGRKNITGPLFNMVEDTIRFFKKHVAKVPNLKGFERVDDDLEFPEDVIREAIVNALVHRDYTVGAHISFRMFRDRIVIKSPGHLLHPNTIKRIKEFDVTSVRRNQHIADAAFCMNLMEREGYGIPNMPPRLSEYGLRPPDFDYDGGYLIVTFYGREKSSPEYRLSSKQRSQLTSRQLDILNLIWERKRISSEDATKAFKITRETATQDFRKLLELNLIERKGSGRATYYVYARK